MARYLTEADAEADGFAFDHDTDRQLFTLAQGDRVMGTAHYSLSGDGKSGTINFDGTQVVPEVRGTGIASLLAHRALSDDIVEGRSIRASCWFMDGYLAKHPELRRS